MKNIYLIPLAVGAIAASQAYAWQPSIPLDVPISCASVPNVGADTVAIRVTPTEGSYGIPMLIGLKGSQVIWKREFPRAEGVNSAKLYATCLGKIIDIKSSPPFTTYWEHQKYRWDGKSLKWLKKFTTFPYGGLTIRSRRTAAPPLNSSVRPHNGISR